MGRQTQFGPKRVREYIGKGKITFSGAISDSMILVLYLLHLQLNY